MTFLLHDLGSPPSYQDGVVVEVIQGVEDVLDIMGITGIRGVMGVMALGGDNTRGREI